MGVNNMHVVIIRGTQFPMSTNELDNLLKTSYYDTFTTHSNGSQRQINVQGIDNFSIVTPHCLDTAMDLVQKYQYQVKAGE